ncbi:MAG: GGDEF domain-containing protein [Pseudomonadota bacterium]
MTEDLDRTYGVAEEALKAIRALKLAATPRNIELLMAHLYGSHPALSTDFEKAVRPDGSMGQGQADKLYDSHILRTDLAAEIAVMLQRFEAEVSKMSGAVAQSGEDSRGYCDELSTLSGELNDIVDDGGDQNVIKLVEGVIRVARAAQDTNQKLEEQLAESSDEISFLRENIASIQQEAMTDPLTGVKNRKTFDVAIIKTVERAHEEDQPMSLVLADVDHFKRFNDKWGHQTGDQVLRLVADMMKQNVKGQDVLARYGGEEFAIILPATSRDNGVKLADRIRQAVGARALKKRRSNESMGNVTLSMGVAELRAGDTVEAIIERADKCLYQAKSDGRNCVVSDVELASDSEGAAA